MQLRRQWIYKHYKDNNEDADLKERHLCIFNCKKQISISSCSDSCMIPTAMIIKDLLSVHLHSHYSMLNV